MYRCVYQPPLLLLLLLLAWQHPCQRAGCCIKIRHVARKLMEDWLLHTSTYRRCTQGGPCKCGRYSSRIIKVGATCYSEHTIHTATT
jgi:hypothetical protein